MAWHKAKDGKWDVYTPWYNQSVNWAGSATNTPAPAPKE